MQPSWMWKKAYDKVDMVAFCHVLKIYNERGQLLELIEAFREVAL